MKLWFRFALVCLAIVCLLLSLSQQAGSNYQLPVARSGPGLDRCREPTSSLPTASVVKSMEFHPARAGPLESLVLDCALTVSNINPFCLNTHGPPGQWNLRGLGELLVKPATQNKKKPSSNLSPLSPKFPAFNPPKLKNRGFAPRFS
jgi:hypothetical protein